MNLKKIDLKSILNKNYYKSDTRIHQSFATILLSKQHNNPSLIFLDNKIVHPSYSSRYIYNDLPPVLPV